jgi:hypothetical protein
MKTVRNWILLLGALGFGYVWLSSTPTSTFESRPHSQYTQTVESPAAKPITEQATAATRLSIPTSTSTSPSPAATLSNSNYYNNRQGQSVHAPAYSDNIPAGATAKCRDGTYSFSQSRRGTCSHHGGVATWL